MSRRGGRPWAVAVGVVLLGGTLTAAERQTARHGGAAARGAAACPAGTHPDPVRAARVVGQLTRTALGRELRQQAARAHAICFGPAADSALVGRGELVVLDERGGDIDNAARLGHLMSHATALAALPELDGASPCDEVVAAAHRAEERAHAIEHALRRELGAVGGETPSQGQAPLPELDRAYRARCESSRARRRSGHDPSAGAPTALVGPRQ